MSVAPARLLISSLSELLNLQNHARAALRHERNIAAELDRVAKTLLSVQKNGLAGDFVLPQP